MSSIFRRFKPRRKAKEKEYAQNYRKAFNIQETHQEKLVKERNEAKRQKRRTIFNNFKDSVKGEPRRKHKMSKHSKAKPCRCDD